MSYLETRRSAAVSLYQLLDALEAAGTTLPHGTAHIRVDTDLCLHLDDATGLNAGDLYKAFFGKPVRAARAIIIWSQREAPNDLEEQTAMIRRWGYKSGHRRTRHLRSVA